MKQAVKISLIVAAVLIFAGIVIGVIGLANAEWEFKSEEVYQRHEMSFAGDEISHIKTACSATDIKVFQNKTETITLVYFDSEKRRFTVDTNSGVLAVKDSDTRNWLDYLSHFWYSDKQYALEIGIPSDFDGELELYTSSGEIYISDVSISGNLTVRASSGNIYLSDVSAAGAIAADLTSGNIEISNAKSGGSVDIDSSSGNISVLELALDGSFSADITSGLIRIQNVSGANDIAVSSSSGDVRFSGISAASFNIEATSGNIGFEDISADDSIVLRTSSGDITGKIDDTVNNFSITSKTSSGNNNLPSSLSLGDVKLDVRVFSGNIDISFAD